MDKCKHEFIYMETVKQRGERPSFGISSSVEWKRIDRFYCNKCLDIKDITKTVRGYEDKPDWFD